MLISPNTVSVYLHSLARTALTHVFEWRYCSIPLTEYWSARIKAMVNSSNVYMSLGNTSMAWHELYTIQSQFDNNFVLEKDSLKNSLPSRRQFFDEYPSLRHPEPRWVAEAKVTNPDLQMLGSWEKLQVAGKGLIPRQGDAVCVWNSASISFDNVSSLMSIDRSVVCVRRLQVNHGWPFLWRLSLS